MRYELYLCVPYGSHSKEVTLSLNNINRLGSVVETYKITNQQLSKENFKEKEKLVTGPDCGLTPGQTSRVTVGRKITLTLTLEQTSGNR
jgi:hypothetical protein